MTWSQRMAKRGMDIFLALVGLLFFWWLILLAAVVAATDTVRSGFYFQPRIGKDGKMFRLEKITTMRDLSDIRTTVSTTSDPRITGVGQILRRSKIVHQSVDVSCLLALRHLLTHNSVFSWCPKVRGNFKPVHLSVTTHKHAHKARSTDSVKVSEVRPLMK